MGWPECGLTLAQATIYMATAPKSRASTNAVTAALAEVKERRTIPVPEHLRSSRAGSGPRPGEGAKTGITDDSGGVSSTGDYLGVDHHLYIPTDHGFEREIAQRMKESRTVPPAAPRARDE